jgi:predicted SAM-dependent methyltransferase
MDFSRTRFSWSRPLTDYTKVQQVIGAFIRGRSIQVPRALRKSRYLNAGCGLNVRNDFINLDYEWRPGVDLCWDLRKPISMPDASLDGIYSEHCLEHLSYDDALFALREFRRLLRPGRIARVAVPNVALYIDLYRRYYAGEKVSFPYADDPPQGFTPLLAINNVFRGYGHQYAYDADTMARALERAGFRALRQVRYHEGDDPRLLIDTEWRALESLYMEATA